jgi:hypothetical protein
MFVDMNKAMGRRKLLSSAAALGALAALQAPGLVEAAGSAAAGRSPVGSWMFKLTVEGDDFMSLVAFTKDGVVIVAGEVHLAAPLLSENFPITGGLGTWTRTADGGIAFAFVKLVAGIDGALLRTETVRGHDLFGADGSSLHGLFDLTAESGGKVVLSGSGTGTGTRIKPAK